MHVGREDARGPDVEAGERHKGIAQGARPAQARPGNRLPVGGGFGAVALEGLAAAVEAQGDARGDVGGEGQGDEQRLGDGGLVVGPGEEEVAVGLWDGAREKRDEGGIRDVEGGEDGEGVRRVLLDAGHCAGQRAGSIPIDSHCSRCGGYTQ